MLKSGMGLNAIINVMTSLVVDCYPKKSVFHVLRVIKIEVVFLRGFVFLLGVGEVWFGEKMKHLF